MAEAEWLLWWKHVTKDRPIYTILFNLKPEEIATCEKVFRMGVDDETKKPVKIWYNQVTLTDGVRVSFK